MYLLTVAVAEEEGHRGPLGLSTLAATLGVTAASANEMVRKLGVRELVDYRPYRGVELTEAGKEVARYVLRTRRLWVVFLADHLGFSPRQADDLACQLEHVTPPEASDRLAAYLENPAFDPLGRPIPAKDWGIPAPAPEPLTRVPAGSRVEIACADAEGTVTAFLAREGVVRGAVVHVVALGTGSVVVETDAGRVHLDTAVAEDILVYPAR